MKQNEVDYLASLELLERAANVESIHLAELLIESAVRLCPALDVELCKAQVMEIWLAREFENRCNLFG